MTTSIRLLFALEREPSFRASLQLVELPPKSR
jgi:hypothetical protein